MTVHCSLLALRGIAQHCIQKTICILKAAYCTFVLIKIQASIDIFDPLTQLEMSEVSWEERCKRSLKTG